MIHPSVRKAIGWIRIDDALAGHAVLIGPRQVATCAHLLSMGAAAPEGAFEVELPNLPLSTTARVSAWRPYDPALGPGTDIAILTLDAAAPPESWVRLDTQRPGAGSEVATLDFQTARSDGDVRRGGVLDGEGDVISLDGALFVEPGLSGGGLFKADGGAFLIGLISSRPRGAAQTTGYTIPAEHVAVLAAERDQTQPEVETLVALALASVGDNLRPFLEPLAKLALEALARPRDEWREEDVCALADLQLELGDALPKETEPSPAPSGFAAVLARLRAICASLGERSQAPGARVDLDAEMERFIREAREEIVALIDGDCPADALQGLRQLETLLGLALARGEVRLGQLSDRTEMVRRRAGALVEDGARALMAAIGVRPDLAPPLAIFVEPGIPHAPEMVVMPTGRFMMGSPEEEPERYDDEGPRHEVAITAPFALARYPMTFDVYDAFCTATGRERPEDEGLGRGRRPAINVRWDEAVAWCAWASGETGAGYRLPSEAEWEYACRAGTETAYSWGVDWDPQRANGARKMRKTEEVGAYPANRWRLVDMHGNVWEWCEDDWDDDYTVPRSQYPLVAQPRSTRRVVRGGSSHDGPRTLRSANRDRNGPDFGYHWLGFRPARTLLTP